MYLPQTVPTTILAASVTAESVEAKALPQRRPPLVWSAMAMAAMAAVSAPGIWKRYTVWILVGFIYNQVDQIIALA